MSSKKGKTARPSSNLSPGHTRDGRLDGRTQESVLRPPPAITTADKVRRQMPAVAGFGLPFVLIVLLAIESGGYDLVLRSQVGIIVWWVALLGIAIGVMPVIRVTRAGWVALALLGGLAAVTALGTATWTESAERSMIELGRILSIFGAFVLLLVTQDRQGLRRSVVAVGAAAALIAVIALTDRFDPGLLPLGDSQPLPEAYPRARLNYPLEYWNGLAALLAIGLGPLLWAASSARNLLGKAVAAGVIPVVVLAAYMTASRGGLAASAAALLALIVFFPQRLKLLVSAVAPALGAVALIVMVNRRPEVRDLVPGDPAAGQGTEMMLICGAVFLVVAGVQAWLTQLVERGSLVLPRISADVTRRIGLAFAAAAVAVVILGLVSGFFGDRWSEFKQPVQSGTVSRLGTLNSSERYFLWDSALDAAASEKITGIGPGAYELWWAREGVGEQFVRDAHSLYLEYLAEAGPLAFLLICALVFGLIFHAFRLAVRHRAGEKRALLAASGAGLVAFAVAAGVDWAWELTVLPVAFFALAAATIGPDAETGISRRQSDHPGGRPAIGVRAIAVAGALLAIAVIAVPLAGTQLVRSSQEEVRAGNLDRALDQAERASDLLPYAASPRIQRAQILQLQGRDEEGVKLAREAIDKESGNWRNWLVLAQLLNDSSPQKAERALRRAKALNPKSPIFAGGSSP